MESLVVDNTTSLIACCLCGTPIEHNAANMCVACLQTEVDLTTGFSRDRTIECCPKCSRFLKPAASGSTSHWVAADLGSRELMALCLERFRDLRKSLRLADARFEYTEPHSKRIKLRLVVESEIEGGAKLQQTFIATLKILSHQCSDCNRVEAKNFWQACVQVRQRRVHKKTLLYLEQVILKYRAHEKCTNIKSVPEGLDFFFSLRDDASKFTDFVINKVPAKYQPPSKKLVSSDIQNNTHNCKYTYVVEIAPICKDDVICLPPKLAQRLGNLSQVCLVYRVTDRIHLIDPQKCLVAKVSGAEFWRNPFGALSAGRPHDLTEFMVLRTEPVLANERHLGGGHAPESKKHVLSDALVMRTSDMQTELPTFTHLGHVLHEGDLVLGFEVRCSNVNNTDLERMMERKPEAVPDVILLKKVYEDSKARHKKRRWQLKRLRAESDSQMSRGRDDGEDYMQFLEDLEEDVAYRQNVNLYKDLSKAGVMPVEVDENDGTPQISLQEMLDDLNLGPPGADATGESGAAMMD